MRIILLFGFPLGIRDGLSVDVHGRLNVGLSQQFLLHLHVHAQRTQHGRVGVTEGVPADLDVRDSEGQCAARSGRVQPTDCARSPAQKHKILMARRTGSESV